MIPAELNEIDAQGYKQYLELIFPTEWIVVSPCNLLEN